jgi:hypothetical protein
VIVALLVLVVVLSAASGAWLEALGLAVFTAVVAWAIGRGAGERPRGVWIWWPGGGWRR